MVRPLGNWTSFTYATSWISLAPTLYPHAKATPLTTCTTYSNAVLERNMQRAWWIILKRKAKLQLKNHSRNSLPNSNFYLTKKRKLVFARSAFPASTINRHCRTLLVIAPVVRLAGSKLGVAHRATIRPNAHALIQADPGTIQGCT